MTLTKSTHLTARASLIAVVLLTSLIAQDPPVTGPVAGYLFDAASGIRPILGVPGAATIGRPLTRGSGLGDVVFSPSRDYALALVPRSGRVALIRGLSASAATVDLGVVAGVARAVLSPSGSAAALYYPQTRTVSIVTGLPESPSIAWNAEAPYLSGGLGALAVSDGGAAALIVAASEQASVWLLMPASGAKFLWQVSSAPSVAFLTESPDAVLADGGSGLVVLIRDPGGKAEATQIGGAAEGVSRPVAVAAADGNRRVLVANAEPAGVVSLSLVGEASSALPCNCRVTALERMAGGTSFRLNSAGDGPVWLLEAADPPRLVFVPDSPPAPRQNQRARLPIRLGGER